MKAPDIFVFALDDNGDRICAYRSSVRCAPSLSKSINISDRDIDFIKSHFASYDPYPFLVCADNRPFLVSCRHYPSSELCFGIIPDCSLPLAKKLYLSTVGEKYISPSLSSIEVPSRINSNGKAEFNRALRFIKAYTENHGIIRSSDPLAVLQIAKEVIAVAEEFIGCNTHIEISHFKEEDISYDISLFSIVTLCALLLAYNFSENRDANIKFFANSSGIMSSFSFDCYEKSNLSENFSKIIDHTSRLGMPFDNFSNGKNVRVEFCAIRPDMAIAELKKPIPTFIK